MNTTADTIHVTRDGEGEHWLVVTDVVTIKASGQHTSGNLLVIEVTVPPGGGPRPSTGTRIRRPFSFRRATSRSARWMRTMR